MNEKEVMIQTIRAFQYTATCLISHVNEEFLSWQPDSESNIIAHLYWHMCRSLDQLLTNLDAKRLTENEIWFTKGWLEKTGFDPRDIEWKQLQHLADYSREENEGIPILSREELLTYMAVATWNLIEFLEGLKPKELNRASGAGFFQRQSRNYVFWSYLTIAYMRLGQIQTIVGMQK